MKNIVVLQKNKDGSIYCQAITENGKKFIKDNNIKYDGFWDKGGTILLEELEEILDREI